MPTTPRKTTVLPGLSDEGSGSFLSRGSTDPMRDPCRYGTWMLGIVRYDNHHYHE